jgi:hypothetical protein
MSRLWQTFVAPGTGPIAGGEAPWFADDRVVRLPDEHWQLILDFAASLDPAAAAQLREYSLPEDGRCLPDTLCGEKMIRFLDMLQAALLAGPRLSPFVSDEIPDDYEREQHQAMVLAVQLIFREALHLGEPFRAWVD